MSINPEWTAGLAVVRKLVEYLPTKGWVPRRTDDGEERVLTINTKEVMEVVESVDASTIYFVNLDVGDREWVAVIPGNGGDAICDYSICDDSFDKVMEDFFRENSEMML